MKKLLCAFCLSLILLTSLSPLTLADNRSVHVWIAKSNSAYAYHSSSNCYHLSRSKIIEVTLEEAVIDYGRSPCKDCNPPRPDFAITPIHTESPYVAPKPTSQPVEPSSLKSQSLDLEHFPWIAAGSGVGAFATYKVMKRREEKAKNQENMRSQKRM